MSDTTSSAERLRVAIHQHLGLVRVIGRGSYRISPGLKDFSSAALNRGVNGIVLDMIDCIGMDSTFMGVLAGLSMRLAGKSPPENGRVVLINLSPKLRRLLTTLGLDQLVDVYLAGETPAELAALTKRGLQESGTDTASEASRKERMETMLSAHEDLVEALPQNKPQFKDVLDFLRQDIARESASHE